MTTVGLWMLLALGALITTTGLPIWALLVGTSSAFAVAGLLMGVVDINVLAALSPRIVGLLENDLLQALPLTCSSAYCCNASRWPMPFFHLW